MPLESNYGRIESNGFEGCVYKAPELESNYGRIESLSLP